MQLYSYSVSDGQFHGRVWNVFWGVTRTERASAAYKKCATNLKGLLLENPACNIETGSSNVRCI